MVSISRSALTRTVLLLIGSNTFMTFAWYGHLKVLATRPWYVAAIASWGVAFFEYMLMVPANRIGYSALTLPQLKVLQETITLLVFLPIAIFVIGQTWKWDYLWAGLCLVGAVYFAFRT